MFQFSKKFTLSKEKVLADQDQKLKEKLQKKEEARLKREERKRKLKEKELAGIMGNCLVLLNTTCHYLGEHERVLSVIECSVTYLIYEYDSETFVFV